MNISQKSVQKFLIIVTALLVLTVGLRMYNLSESSFTADEFLDMNSSYGYAQIGSWQAWDFNFQKPATMNVNEARDERAVLYKWQVAQVFQVLEPTEEHARLVSVLWGAVSLLALVFATWFFTGRLATACIAGFLFAVAVSALIFDRRLRMYSMFYPLYLLTSVFLFGTLERMYEGRIGLVKWFQRKTGYHLIYGIFFTLFFGISLLVHQLTASILFTLIAYCLFQAVLLWKMEKRNIRWNIYTRSLVLIAGVILLSLLILPDFTRSFSAGLIWLDDHYSYLRHFFSDFEHPIHAVLVVLAGTFFLSRVGRNKEGSFLFFSAFVPLFLAIWFWRRNVGPQYIFFAQSFLLVLAAAGVTGIASFLKLAVQETKLFSARITPYVGLIVVGIGLLILPRYSYFFQEENTFHQPAASSETNYRKLFTVFNKQFETGEVLVTRNFRNYYFAGKKVEVYDFGGELSEGKLQKIELEELRQKYAHGWLVLSKNDFDYVSNEAEAYLESDLYEKVKHTTIKGGNAVYRW